MIIGELINTSRSAVNEAVGKRDGDYIKEIAQKQVEAGAHYLDINCGTLINNEKEIMEWLVDQVQSAVSSPLCIDSPDPLVIEAGLALNKNGQPMINSISGERERYERVLPLALQYRAKVVALLMDDTGMPETAGDRLRIAGELVNNLVSAGVPIGDIYLDPLVKPVSSVDTAGAEVLEAVRMIKDRFPGVHFTCGLSNVSFGLPCRKVLNQVFMIQTMAVGIDSYILDPLDRTMMGLWYASRTLLGLDEYCGDYLAAYRRGIYQ